MLTTYKLSSQLTMSSQPSYHVPVLDGANYGVWSKAMKAFLMSLGLWVYTNRNLGEPSIPNYGDTPTAEQLVAIAQAQHQHDEWAKFNNMAIGHMVLHSTPPIQKEFVG
jgi:hypothetical protein